MNASNQAPVSSFWICMTCVRASEPSFLATNSSVGGCSLNVPESAASAFAIASSREIVGVVEGTDAVRNQSVRAPRNAMTDLLGLTNEEPNETTLLALLNAMFATALATGTPF